MFNKNFVLWGGKTINRSIEYIKNRILNDPDSVMNMPIEGWDDAMIFNPIHFFTTIPEFELLSITDSLQLVLSNEERKINLNIKYDPLASFDYFTMNCITYDGTLYFLMESIGDLLFKLTTLQTYFNADETKDFRKNPFNYDVKYIIGDIIVHRDFGMKSINGHEMMGETNIIVLPIKFELFEKQ